MDGHCNSNIPQKQQWIHGPDSGRQQPERLSYQHILPSRCNALSTGNSPPPACQGPAPMNQTRGTVNEKSRKCCGNVERSTPAFSGDMNVHPYNNSPSTNEDITNRLNRVVLQQSNVIQPNCTPTEFIQPFSQSASKTLPRIQPKQAHRKTAHNAQTQVKCQPPGITNGQNTILLFVQELWWKANDSSLLCCWDITGMAIVIDMIQYQATVQRTWQMARGQPPFSNSFEILHRQLMDHNFVQVKEGQPLFHTLNMHKILHDRPTLVAYHHPCFQRNRPDLLWRIQKNPTPLHELSLKQSPPTLKHNFVAESRDDEKMIIIHTGKNTVSYMTARQAAQIQLNMHSNKRAVTTDASQAPTAKRFAPDIRIPQAPKTCTYDNVHRHDVPRSNLLEDRMHLPSSQEQTPTREVATVPPPPHQKFNGTPPCVVLIPHIVTANGLVALNPLKAKANGATTDPNKQEVKDNATEKSMDYANATSSTDDAKELTVPNDPESSIKDKTEDSKHVAARLEASAHDVTIAYSETNCKGESTMQEQLHSDDSSCCLINDVSKSMSHISIMSVSDTFYPNSCSSGNNSDYDDFESCISNEEIEIEIEKESRGSILEALAQDLEKALETQGRHKGLKVHKTGAWPGNNSPSSMNPVVKLNRVD